ncbi:MAG TPA: tetratricopeptide repeat protein [Spirochaetales bacterium]|nr:tetratricopeptide repeat protein [Spirochaetales bacterium]HRY53660.1 tetratricopeptide repeat protein [Spirochaetia bacterium]HRZ65563.1 tetratricopeptide repeat protein [Spirochaetia bacterium]
MDRAGRLAACLLAAVAAAQAAFAAGAFEEGERLFRENKPREAAAALERAAAEPGSDERALLYLGLAYQQLGRLDEAAQAFRRGASSSQRWRPLFLFDLGNVYLIQGKNSFAAEILGQAIEADPGLAGAYLNRGNARLSIKDFPGARDDYARYLELEPGSAQRSSIEELLRRLASGIEESKRAEAEAEARRIAAEEARKALLDQVSASLKAAADETQSLSSGSGAVQGYGDELNLDE